MHLNIVFYIYCPTMVAKIVIIFIFYFFSGMALNLHEDEEESGNIFIPTDDKILG